MINIEWAKLKAVAKYLNCTELQAKEKLNEGRIFIYTLDEAKKIRIFLNRLQVRQTEEQVISYDDNKFILLTERT